MKELLFSVNYNLFMNEALQCLNYRSAVCIIINEVSDCHFKGVCD
jgi:hypothetical protein